MVLAIELGWRMADTLGLATHPKLTNTMHIPSHLNRLTNYRLLERWQRFCIQIHRVDQIINQMAGIYPACQTLPPHPKLPDPLHPCDQTTANRMPSMVNDLNISLLIWLHIVDPLAGEAYRLGNGLAGLCAAGARAQDPQKMLDSFFGSKGGKEKQLSEYLEHLSVLLPPYAADAVRQSLHHWSDTVVKACGPEQQRRKLYSDDQSLESVPEISTLRAALGEQLKIQGKAWLDLLTGRRPALHLLKEEDYLSAANAVVRRDMELVRKKMFRENARHLTLGVLLPLLLTAILVAVVTAVGTGGSAAVRSVATLTALIAAGGAIWRIVSVLTRQATARINDPIYNRSLTTQITYRLDEYRRRALGKARRPTR